MGLFPNFRVAHELAQVEQAEQPDPAHSQRYTALSDLFQQAYAALEPTFEPLSTLVE